MGPLHVKQESDIENSVKMLFMINPSKILISHGYDDNIMLAGDNHANWVSDLVWLDEENYNPDTGEGALGAEFGGTTVSSTGPCDEDEPISACNKLSHDLVRDNKELQRSEGCIEVTSSCTSAPSE
jgi:hypothetical protein